MKITSVVRPTVNGIFSFLNIMLACILQCDLKTAYDLRRCSYTLSTDMLLCRACHIRNEWTPATTAAVLPVIFVPNKAVQLVLFFSDKMRLNFVTLHDSHLQQ